MTDLGRPKYDAAANYQAMAAEVRRLRALLQRLEWSSDTEQGQACPWCGLLRDGGRNHLDDCQLAAELDGTGRRRTRSSK
jgi:hypothetical protein